LLQIKLSAPPFSGIGDEIAPFPACRRIQRGHCVAAAPASTLNAGKFKGGPVPEKKKAGFRPAFKD